MQKKIKNCFYKKLTFEKLLQAHNRAKKHKTYKAEVIKFELNLENNLINLLNTIKNRKYRVGKYHTFKIYEPKERIIKALPYVDRIVHQWYVEEFIKPFILPKFISNSYACLENKGTHKAASKVQENLQKFKRNNGDFWILKCDIRKFFYSINPNILFSIMEKYIADKELLNFTRLLIFDGRQKDETIGIPIGNYTSQYFANIYLNELDQYIKRVLKNTTLVRYMDDFVLLAKTKQDCIYLKKEISNFLDKNLQLQLNDKSKYYPYKMGVNFCGYRIFCTHRLLRLSSKKKIKNKVKKWNKEYHNNCIDYKYALQSINSWLGHSSFCNCYNLQNKILNSCDFLFTDKTYSIITDNLIKNIEEFNKNLT